MNIKCLFGYHDWKFSYNHGMPLGVGWKEYDKMWKDGKTYAVDMCTRRGCGKQSRIVDGKRIILHRGEMENP